MDLRRERLDQQDWSDVYERLYAFARARSGSADQAGDLVNGAIARVYAFDAKWDPTVEPDLVRHLMSVVNSLLANDRTSARARRDRSMHDDGPVQAQVARIADPAAAQLAEQQLYARRIEQLRTAIAGDAEATRVLDLMLEGLRTPTDLRRATGWTDAVLHAARMRIQRRALAIARADDQQSFDEEEP